MLIVAICGKGGCGKTTTTWQMATGLAARGHRVMAVDGNDQPEGLSDLFGVSRTVGIKDCLTDGKSLLEVSVDVEGVVVVPTGSGLEHVDLDKLYWDDLFIEALLDEIEQKPDYVLIDCSPVLQSVVSASALACADYAITCVRANKADTRFIGEVKLRAEETVDEMSTDLPLFATIMTGVPRVGIDRIAEINLGVKDIEWPPNAPKSVKERLQNVMKRDSFLGATPAAPEESKRDRTIRPFYDQILSNMIELNGHQ